VLEEEPTIEVDEGELMVEETSDEDADEVGDWL
jgi:hypothetical protein